jgi:lipoate-protein ligase A
MSPQSRPRWRLLYSPPAVAAANMATDEAIQLAVGAGEAIATIRFYSWEPPCLSLGRGQRVRDADRAALRAAGFDIVRRPTGGRAILHADELTYSIAARLSNLLVRGTIVESYRRLSRGLARGLQLLGLSEHSAGPQHIQRGSSQGPACFQITSHYEISFQGRKLLGSAQARTGDALLQHGSLPLRGDLARICPLLTAGPSPESARARAVTLGQALGCDVAWAEAAEALAAGFAEEFGIRLERGELTPDERRRARSLERDKYATEKWTARV